MGIFDSVKQAVQKTSEVLSESLEHENTKAAVAWAKDIAKSDLVKDAAAGAAVGAVVAVPVPIIGPAAGAVVGAGIGVFKNLTKPVSTDAEKPQLTVTDNKPQIDISVELRKLDELRKEGILTDSEFQTQKDKLLNRS